MAGGAIPELVRRRHGHKLVILQEFLKRSGANLSVERSIDLGFGEPWEAT